MIKKTLLLFFLTTSISLHSQEWKQKESTTVTFKIKNLGVNVDGNFSDVKIKTNFNSKNFSQSYINATIAVVSISTGIESRDKSLVKKDYFNEFNHKSITLKSTRIEKKTDETFNLFADLTIKGKTRKVEIPLEVSETDSSITFKANFSINRKDFKVGGGSFIMSKTVKVQVEYSGTK